MENTIRNESITFVIDRIFDLAEMVTKQLKTEKKETGEFSQIVTIAEEEFVYSYALVDCFGRAYPENAGKLIPPTSRNFMLEVLVKKEGENFFSCRIEKATSTNCPSPLKCIWTTKWRMSDAVDCDMSNIVPLLHSGDVVALRNESQEPPCRGKVALAKIEILNVEEIDDNKLLKVRLTKDLGHKDIYAYNLGNDHFPTTYSIDESTQEYFGDKDSIDTTAVISNDTEEVCFNSAKWRRYTLEKINERHRLNKLYLRTPISEQELTRREKKEALSKLIKDCEAEFCYGDSRVEKYLENHEILGIEIIDTIYTEYMAWLNEHCTTFAEDSPSGEFTGIAIDWHGNKDNKPSFETLIE